MSNPFDTAPETHRGQTPKAEKRYSRTEIESLREKRDDLQEKIKQLQSQLFRADSELSKAMRNQEEEKMANFAEPVVIPEDWKAMKEVDLNELLKGRPDSFGYLLHERKEEDKSGGHHQRFLKDYAHLGNGEIDEISAVTGDRLAEVAKRHFQDWKPDDFKALLKGIEGKESVVSTQSFDELVSIVKKKIDDINDYDHYYYSGSGTEYRIQDLFKEFLNTQDPKIASIDLGDEDAVEEAVRGAVRADENSGKMYFMDEAIFDYENGDSGRASHFDRNSLARGLEAFMKRYAPFLKRESKKRKTKDE